MNSRSLAASFALVVSALAVAPIALAQTSAAGTAALPAKTPAAPVPVARAAASAGATATELHRLGDAFADVVEKLSPSVVQIEVTVSEDVSSPLRWFREGGQRRGLGSGVIFSSDGAILTNNHVIEDARTINVRLRDGRAFAGRVVGRDPATDLAVLRIGAKALPAATFADSDAARVGTWVVAIGSPFGLGHTVTTGVLSAKGRGGVGVNAIEDYLQTDASINPGNSGGPLVDLDGRVLGINTMVVSTGQGIGLAVPANMARRVADQLLRTGRVVRAWLGVGMQDLTPQLAAEIPAAPKAGALVNAVSPNGPAAKANLQPGDIIATIGGKPIRDAQDVFRELFHHDTGETLSIEVVRGGKRYTTKATLAARSEPMAPMLPVQRTATPQPGLGLTIRNAQQPREVSGAGVSAVRVVSVAQDSVADRAGVRAGDLILEADGNREPTAAQVQEAASDGRLLVRIYREAAEGATFYAALSR